VAAPRRRRWRLIALVGVLLLSVAAGIGWRFQDQLLGDDAASATERTSPVAVTSGQREGATEAQGSEETAPVTALEGVIQDAIAAMGAAAPDSVNCLGPVRVRAGDLLDCTVGTLSKSVEISVLVAATSPVDFTSNLDPADFREPEPTVHEERAAAVAELEQLRGQDINRLPLDGRWAVQLSSKAEGITDPLQLAENGSHTFHAPDILAEHLRFRSDARFGGDVVLVNGTDFGEVSTFNGRPFWITLVLGQFTSGADVEAWCETQFTEMSPDQIANACLPRTLDPPR
jgi:hypothetical protein